MHPNACSSLAAALLASSLPLSVGCAPKPAAAGPVVAHAPQPKAGPLPVYRLDFVLTTTEGGSGSVARSFTMNLEEREHGSVMVGANVPLTVANGSVAVPRQDVGFKLVADFQTVGDDVLVHVDTESSSSSPPAIHKAMTHSSALAIANRPSIVSIVDDDHRRRELAVTATRLR